MLSSNLEWFIAKGRRFDWPSQPFASTIPGMIGAGHHEWRLVNYRCAYGNDDIWNKYMKCFEDNVLAGLDANGGDVVVSDRVEVIPTSLCVCLID
jgi:hypothetical protein